MSQDILSSVMQTLVNGQKRDLPAFRESITPDCVWSSNYPPQAPFSGQARGPEAILNLLAPMVELFEFLASNIRQTIIQGDTAVIILDETFRARTTGKSGTSLSAIIATVRNGKVSSLMALADTYTVINTLRPDEEPKRP